MSHLFCALFVLGSISVIITLIKLFLRLKPYFTAPTDLKKIYAGNNNDVWAVVTGASEGIGKQFAISLSK